MNVGCPGCGASYFVDEQKIPARGGKLTCTGCGARWTIYRPGTAEVPAAGRRSSASREAAREAAASAPASRVTCPRCGHAFVPGAATAPAAAEGRKLILLVEDQKYFTELAGEALGKEYRTVSAATRDEALQAIAAERPSLMILDLSLARGQDGRDLLRSIPAKSFPILIFTARDETELYGEGWDELRRLGADDIVRKGMNVGDELRRKVASLIEKR